MAPRNPQFSLYLPRTLLAWQASEPERRTKCVDGTLLFADISGFTPLVERMSALGRAGSEEVTDLINRVFDEIIAVGTDEGGDVLKFGGDACLLLFEGEDHALRAARTALDMQDVLAEFDLPDFGISIGMDSGDVHLVLAGDLHKELLVLGPAVDRTLDAEKAAETGQVVAGAAAARLLPRGCIEDGLVVDVPDEGADPPEFSGLSGDGLDLADYIPLGLRDYLSVAGSDSEHRHAAVGFVQVKVAVGDGDDVPVDELEHLTSVIEAQAARHDVAVMGCDVDIGAIKFILCAGAPSSTHLEEERMLRALRRIMDDAPALPLRMGVTRGLIFAGDIGATSRRYYSLLGDAVNLAARLMGAAEPGQILTLDYVLDRSPTRFAVDRLPPLMLKGKSKPVAPLALGAIVGVERVDWARFLPITGREDELGIAVTALADARAGVGSVLEIIGDSGVGKTRLLNELVERAALVDTHQVICQHYETSTPYFVIGHVLRGALALKPDSHPDEVAARIDEILAIEPELAAWRPLIGLPLDLTLPETAETEALSSEFRTAKLHEVVEQLLAVVRPDPTLFTVEDAQWVDAASQSVLEHLMGSVRRHPWLFALTQHQDSWASAAMESTVIQLEPLDPVAASQLLHHAARERPVSDEMLATIAERSGGHPFFALELLRHADNETLPESVEMVVAERIDRLEARDRQLLRYVSVLGNSFAFDLLAEALPQVAPSAEDTETWQRLSEFLDVTVFGTVQFKQDLIRLAAYEGLSFRRRREVHGIIAEAIERRARRRANRQAALLSQHYYLAERWEKAWQFSLVAAEQARSGDATVDAVRLYERALASAAHLDEPDESALAELNESLGDVAARAGLPDRSELAYETAASIRPVDGVDEARLARKMGSLLRDRGDFERADASLARARAITDGAVDDELRLEHVETLVAVAAVRHRAGDFEASCVAALEAIDEAEHIDASASFARAASIMVVNQAALASSSDRDFGAEALAVFEELGDSWGKAKVLNNLGMVQYYAGDWVETARLWEQSRTEYRAAGDASGAATAENNLGEIRADQGRLDEAEEHFQEALRAWRAARFPVGVALGTQNLGRVASRRGEIAEGERLLREALEGFEAIGLQAYVADTKLRLAQVHAFGGRLGPLRKALDALDDGEEAAPIAPVRRRLEALAAYAAGDAESGERLLRASIERAQEVAVPYEEALSLRLLGDLTGDGRALVAADEILDRMGAAQAARIVIPHR